jgi:hypothetical protein
MVRTICGVLGGIAAWFLIAEAGNRVLRVMWSGYSEAEAVRTFTLAMLIAPLARNNFIALRRVCRCMGQQPQLLCDQIARYHAGYHVPAGNYVVGRLSTLVSPRLSRITSRYDSSWLVTLSRSQKGAAIGEGRSRVSIRNRMQRSAGVKNR